MDVTDISQRIIDVLLLDLAKTFGTDLQTHYSDKYQELISTRMNGTLNKFFSEKGITRPVACVNVYMDGELELPSADLILHVEGKDYFCTEWLDKQTLEKALSLSQRKVIG